MGLRVVHKGLILVAVPLALQLSIVAALSWLLSVSDREQNREAQRCKLSMTGARLMFANCNAGATLIHALQTRDPSAMDAFYQECDYIDGLNRFMSTVPEDDIEEGRALQLKCLKAQSMVTSRLREIADIVNESYGLDMMRQITISHRKLVRELDVTFALLRKRYQDLDAGLPDKWRRLEQLRQAETGIVLGGSVVTAIFAILLAIYYKNQFLKRIEATKENVESLTLGHKISADPLKGDDEIAALDASFRSMSMQLAAVAERERALFENSSDMICVLDENLNFVRVNSAASGLCGRSLESLVESHVSSITVERGIDFGGASGPAAGTDGALGVAGGTGGALGVAAGTSGAHRAVAVAAVTDDITGSAGRGDDDVAAGAVCAISGGGADGALCDVEYSAAAISQSGNLIERIQLAKESGRPTQFETAINGSSGPVITLWSVFWSPDGKSCHCVVHDVSEERELDKVRGAFLRLIAADFSLPLSVISGLVDKLASGECGRLSEMATKKLQTATGTLSRMVNLVDDLVQLETLKSISLNLNCRDVSVRETLLATVRDTEVAAERRRIKVLVDCAADLNFNVDFERIVRVLTNFVSNAIKFSPEGSTINLKAVESPSSEIIVSVIDQGRGIPREILPGLFQPFKQVSSEDGKRGKGTGLGLVVCKRIVEEHGGQVGVESEEGMGSRFWLRVPMSRHLAQGKAASDSCRKMLESGADEEPNSFRVAPDDMNGNRPSSVLPSGSGGKGLNSPDSGSSRSANKVPVSSNNSQLDSLNQGALIPSLVPVKGSFWEKMSFKKKGILLIGIPLFFQVLFMSVMIFLLSESNQSFASQMHNRYVARNAVRITGPFFQLLVALRNDDMKGQLLNVCAEVREEVPRRMAAFKESTSGDGMALEHYRVIVRYMRNTLFPLTRDLQIELDQSGGVITEEKDKAYSNQIVQLVNGLAAHVKQLVEACEMRDKDTPGRLNSLRQYEFIVLGSGVALSALAAAWLAVFFASDVVQRLLVLSDNSQRLSSGAKLNSPLTGNDEIAHLDKAFHEMASRLADARATESTFLDNAHNIICSINKDGRFVALNRAAAAKLLIPYNKVDEYSLSMLLDAGARESLSKVLETVKVTAEPGTLELQISSSENTMDTFWSFIWSESEQLFFAVAYDITARRDLDRMKREFLALVTHDLRTPLTTIQGLAILLETGALGELPEQAKPAITEIKIRSQQILELVNDLLDLSKLEAGELKCEFLRVSSGQLMERVLQGAAAAVNLCAPEDSNEVILSCDLERLSYAITGIILELFSNIGRAPAVVANLEGPFWVLSLEGESDVSVDESNLAAVNDAALALYSSKSSGRVRLPLSRKLLQMHQGEVLARRIDESKVVLQIKIPISGA